MSQKQTSIGSTNMKTKKYKTLKGLMKALDNHVFTLRDMNRGEAWFPNERKTCRFELPEEVKRAFYEGIAKVIWARPKDWQISRLAYATFGLTDRLWWNGNRFEYCAGQDYPSEIRFIQREINSL